MTIKSKSNQNQNQININIITETVVLRVVVIIFCIQFVQLFPTTHPEAVVALFGSGTVRASEESPPPPLHPPNLRWFSITSINYYNIITETGV